MGKLGVQRGAVRRLEGEGEQERALRKKNRDA